MKWVVSTGDINTGHITRVACIGQDRLAERRCQYSTQNQVSGLCRCCRCSTNNKMSGLYRGLYGRHQYRTSEWFVETPQIQTPIVMCPHILYLKRTKRTHNKVSGLYGPIQDTQQSEWCVHVPAIQVQRTNRAHNKASGLCRRHRWRSQGQKCHPLLANFRWYF